MYSSAAIARGDDSGQDQEEQGLLDMSDSYRLNSPKTKVCFHTLQKIGENLA
jgi:hypothetical protein